MLKKVAISPAQPQRAETRLLPGEAAGENNTGGLPARARSGFFGGENNVGGFFQHPVTQRLARAHTQPDVRAIVLTMAPSPPLGAAHD